MSKVLIHVSGLTVGDKEFPKGVPVEANEVLTRMANNKERREGVVAVTWVEAPKAEVPKVESPKAVSPEPVVSPVIESASSGGSGEIGRKEIMAKLKEKGIKFFAGAKTEDLLAKLKEAGE